MWNRHIELNEENSVEENIITKKEVFIIVISAIIAITLCSRSSPIYPFNDWVDSNGFFTVGKSMLSGLVPYRDLFEQKGPLLYMLYALAALVSWKTFLGVYIIEVAAAVCFLFFSYRLMQAHEQGINILYIPVLAAMVYSAPCFSNQVEELSLPFFVYALYVGAKVLRSESKLKKTESFFIGITFACVLWMKFSLLGFYVGWICVIAFLLIKKDRFKELVRMLAWIIIGAFVLTLPIFIYFIANHAVKDLFMVYFYDNIFLYSNLKSSGNLATNIWQNLIVGFVWFKNNNFLTLISIIFGAMMFSIKKEKADFCLFTTCVLLTFLLIYIGGRHYRYYSLILSAFAPFGLIVLNEMIKKVSMVYSFPNIDYRVLMGIVSTACLIFTFYGSGTTNLIHYHRADMPQYQFADIIKRKQNATLLNYGFLDGGFYTTTGIVPNCKYFCRISVPLKEIMETQNEFIKNGKVDFVVTRNFKLKSNIYKCIKTAKWGNMEYSLYRLVKAKGIKNG